MVKIDEQKARKDFIALQPELEKWGTYVDEVLCKFLKEAFPSCEHVQMKPLHRIKNVDSYCEKVLIRKPKEHPLLETTDKVRTRAVLLDTTDVNKVCRFIEQCDVWIVQEHAKDIDQIISEHPEEFTYQSDHYIVRPKDNYPAECDIKLLTCEIQVRTILQHAYAEISHDTMYKKDISLSNQYKRKLASSMAFLEAADEKFVQIYKGMEEYNDNRTDLQNRLIAAYKTVITDYNESAYNVEITLPLIKLLEEIKELKEFYENLDGFMQEKEVLVQNAISTYKDVDILFRHPVIVMALYMILNYQDTLIKNWPYNYDSLEHVVKGMNLSDDILH